MDENKLPHLLLYGPPGTGKTSMILAIAKQMYGERAVQMTLHLNASDARGIDVVRNDIQGFASTRHIFNKGVKLIILDECDAMTNDAQFALRRIMEKYVANVRFALICNQVGKVIPALQSRCTRFRFSPLPAEFVTERLAQIAAEEAGEQPEAARAAAVGAVVKLAGGDMRRALNLLQSVAAGASASGDGLSEAAVYATSGQTPPEVIARVLQLLREAPFGECFRELRAIQEREGFALVDLLGELVARLLRPDRESRESGRGGGAWPPEALQDLLAKLADLEYNLSGSVTEKLQLGGLVGIFVEHRP